MFPRKYRTQAATSPYLPLNGSGQRTMFATRPASMSALTSPNRRSRADVAARDGQARVPKEMTLRLRPAERGDHADRYKGMGGAVKSGASIRDYFRGLLQPDSSGEGSLMYRFVTCLIACSIAWLAVFPARAVEVTSYKLDNGLDVVVIEDHRAPVVVHMVWYRAGAADEPPGKSGIAHFVEHLMFRGTDDLEPGEFSEIVAENGGTDNAFTSWDYTGYFQRVAADRLDLMMRIEADRMRDILFTEQEIDVNREVILEERNQRMENDPGALFAEQRRAALFMNHPYGIPVIGWRHEMEGLELEDAWAFYRKFYAPNNAVLIVAGDVLPENVLELAKVHYGPLEPSPIPRERMRPMEPPQLAERRLLFEDSRVGEPYVVRTYLVPERNPGAQEEAAALAMLAALLGGNSATSVLGRKLQFEERKAIHASAYYQGLSLDYGTFTLFIVPLPGISLREAEDALDRAVAQFMEEGVDPERFDRIKMQLRAARIYAEDSVQTLARDYGSSLTSGLGIDDVEAWPRILQEVTPERVMAAAEELLDRRRSVTGWIRRPGNGEVIQ